MTIISDLGQRRISKVTCDKRWTRADVETNDCDGEGRDDQPHPMLVTEASNTKGEE